MTGLLQYQSAPSPPFFTLHQAICSMENSQQWTYRILTLADKNDGASVLLCVKQRNYYIFDSHSRDIFGNVVPNGTSVLLHMKTHNALMKYIKNIGYQLAASQFEITVLSPVVSGFYQMLQPRQNSQTSQNEQIREQIQEKNYESRRKTRNSSKKQNEKETKGSQNELGDHNISQSTRRSSRISTKKQNKEEIQHSQQLQTSQTLLTKLNKSCKDKKEEQKRKNRDDYHNRKRKIVDNVDKESNISKRKTKYQKLVDDHSSDNTQNTYNTHSKKVRETPISQAIQLNSSESNKQKGKTNQKCRKDDNDNVIKRRRITKNINTTNQNSLNQHIDQLNNIITEEEIDNTNGHVENQSINMDECLKLFNIKISNGPIYVCTVCLQTWFRRSVRNIEFINISSEAEEQKLNQCTNNYISAEDKEWICKGCRDSIKTGRIPTFSIENKMGFPPQPQELKLNGMEERFTAPRLTLFQMRDLPCGGQKSVRGNSVNLPIDIAPTVEMLPHTLDNTETIAINYKHCFCYKGCAFKQENIRPAAVWKPVNYLMTHRQMYKDLDIQLDTSWIRNMETCDSGTCECVQENTQNCSLPPDAHENNEEQNNEDIDNIEEDEELNSINRDTMLSALKMYREN